MNERFSQPRNINSDKGDPNNPNTWKLESVSDLEQISEPKMGDPNDSSTWELEPRPDLKEELELVPRPDLDEASEKYQQPSSSLEEQTIQPEAVNDSEKNVKPAEEIEEDMADKLLRIEEEIIDAEDMYENGKIDFGEYTTLMNDIEAKKVNLEKRTETESETETVTEDELETEPELNVEALEKQQEKAEYLRLKGEFKASEREYYTALDEDYKQRGFAKKLFGIGRGSMSDEVKGSYNTFMAANKAYYEYAQTSGTYQKIAERLNRDHEPAVDNKVSEQSLLDPITYPQINTLVAERHILNPAEKRLEIQSTLLSEKAREVKQNLLSKMKLSPTALKTIGYMTYGYTAYRVFNAPAALAGMAVNYAAGKLSDVTKEVGADTVMHKMEGDNVDLDKLEAEYFNYARYAQGLKTAGKIGAVGATMSVGGAFGGTEHLNSDINFIADKLNVEEKVAALAGQVPNSTEFSSLLDKAADMTQLDAVLNQVPDAGDLNVVIDKMQADYLSPDIVPSASEAVAATSEALKISHEVLRNENVSSILLDTIKERVASGEFVLPAGVDEHQIAHYIYQSFPEMTNASHVASTLSPAEWHALGISSGDPSHIQIGEKIDVGALLDKMRSASGNVNIEVPTETVLPIDVVHQAAQSAASVNVPVELSLEHSTMAETTTHIHVQDAVSKEHTVAEGLKNVDHKDLNSYNVYPKSGAEVLSGHASANLNESLVDFGQSDFENKLNSIKLLDYSPRINDAYLAETYQFTGAGPGVLHNRLVETIYDGYREGAIDLPHEAADNINHNWTATYGFVEKMLPETSTSIWNMHDPGTTPDQWREFGISSGDPNKIISTDVVKIGEIVKFMLEKAKDESLQLQTERLNDLADSLPAGATSNMVEEFRANLSLKS